VKPPGRPTTSGLRAGIRQGLRGGTAALGWTVLAAQIYSFIIYFVAGRPFRPWSFVKIGWLFLLSFSRVGLRLTFRGVVAFVLSGSSNSNAQISISLHLAFLSGTVLACWLLFRAGRRAGQVDAGSRLTRTAAGATVAIPYAAIAFIGSFLAVVRFPEQGVPLVTAIKWEALVLPLAMAAASGAVGGSLSRPSSGRLGESAIGGWRAFVAAIVLSLTGLLVLGVIYPSGTAGYARFVSGHGHIGFLTFVLQILALPNHAALILAPSMGGCDGLSIGSHSVRLLCTGKFAAPSLATFLSQLRPGSVAETFAATPWVFWLFMSVPLAATVVGGRRAGLSERDRWRRVAMGSGSGVVSAVALMALSWAATLDVQLPGQAGQGSIAFGPLITTTIGLALAWGVPGGAVGGLTARWRQEGGSPVPDPGEPESGAPPPGDELVGPEDRPDPPSPTSV
jgi:hypothetical protein